MPSIQLVGHHISEETDAFVIEDDELPTGWEESGLAVAQDDRTRAIHFEFPPTVQLDFEELKRFVIEKRSQHLVEVFSRACY